MKFRKDIFSKDYFANTQVSQFGNIHDFLRGDIIIEGITLGQHVS